MDGYATLPKVLALLLAYAISLGLVRAGKVSRLNQRRFWNLVLLASFVVSCLLGLALAVMIDYRLLPPWYGQVLRLHVQAGIAMTVVGLFHAAWHIPYYRLIFRRPASGKVLNTDNK